MRYCHHMRKKNIIFLGVFMLMLVTTFLVYSPGLSGKFAFDDGPNIVYNNTIAMKHLDLESLKVAMLSGASGILKRPVSMLSFALNYYFTGLNPYYFKLTNILIHLINGILLFCLLELIFDIYRRRFQPQLDSNYIRWLSLATAAAWLLHPLNLTGVLYVVQRMTSLSALFTFLGLIAYLRGRWLLLDGLSAGRIWILSGVLLFLPLAVFSKENGALLPLYMLVFEVTLLNFETREATAKRFLTLFFVMVIALPFVVALGYLAFHPEFVLDGYKLRSFTLMERLLTEPRVIWFYLKMIVFPRADDMGLFHDDITISRGLFDPSTTLIAMVALVGLLASGVVVRKKHPIISIGLLFFFAGHILESTVLSLEITFEHRNYLPMVGILLIIFYFALYPLSHLKSLRMRQLGISLFLGLLAVSTTVRANHWGNLYLLSMSEVMYHPNSPRAQSEMGAMYCLLAASERGYSEQYFAQAVEHFKMSATLDKNNTVGLFGMIYYSSIFKKPVDAAWVSDLASRLSSAPFSITMADKLVMLQNCYENKQCGLPKESVKVLLDAALSNRTLTGLARARVLTALSIYRANLEGDISGALDAAYAAVAADPENPNHRVNLIYFLISIKRFDDAKRQIELAKKADTLGVFSKEIKGRELLLQTALGKRE